MNARRSIGHAVAAVLVCASAGAGAAAPLPTKGFLCCNLWLASGWADDRNAQDPAREKIAVGTPVIPLTFADTRLKFEANGQQLTMGNDYSRDLSPEQFVSRWIVRSDPRRKLAAWHPAVQKEIRAGRVMRGMTREQVAMALGYPTTTATPNLESAEWKYSPYSGYEFLVLFDDKGRVRGVQSDDPKTRASMYSPQPVPVVATRPAPAGPVPTGAADGAACAVKVCATQ